MYSTSMLVTLYKTKRWDEYFILSQSLQPWRQEIGKGGFANKKGGDVYMLEEEFKVRVEDQNYHRLMAGRRECILGRQRMCTKVLRL